MSSALPSITTQDGTIPPAHSLYDELDPLDSLYATLDEHLSTLQSCWTLSVYFDGVLGSASSSLPVDLFACASPLNTDMPKKFIFDSTLYPPTLTGLKILLDTIKKTANEQGTRLMTGNRLGVLVCSRSYPYCQQNNPRNFKKNSLMQDKIWL
jgi:hypothetical protein